MNAREQRSPDRDPDAPRRAPGSRGILVAAAAVAVASALLGILFPPLWIVTIASLVYLVLDIVAIRKRTRERS